MGWPVRMKQQDVVQDEAKDFRFKVGEYLPWKGFMFRVAEVHEKGLRLEVCGVTRKLSHLVKKDER